MAIIEQVKVTGDASSLNIFATGIMKELFILRSNLKEQIPETADPLFLSVESCFLRVNIALKFLGITVKEETLLSDITNLIKYANAVGITHGDITLQFPENIKFQYLLKKLNELYDLAGLGSAYIEEGIDGDAIGNLIKQGKLKDISIVNYIYPRIMPAPIEFFTGTYASSLEPTGLFYGKSQSEQVKLLMQYEKSRLHRNHLSALEASPMSILFVYIVNALISFLSSLLGLTDRSRALFVQNGHYRTTIKIPGNTCNRLSFGSHYAKLGLYSLPHDEENFDSALPVSVGTRLY